MKRRSFLLGALAVPAVPVLGALVREDVEKTRIPQHRGYRPGRIVNDYSLLLPGEQEALARAPRVTGFTDSAVQVDGHDTVPRGGSADGWRLLAILALEENVPTAVFEKHVAHQGAIVYVTKAGVTARIPKRIGQLSNVRPRPIHTPHMKFERPAALPPQADVPGEYILNSSEDPCYENVAALGSEYVGWTLVGNEEGGPETSLYLEADGRSRQLNPSPHGQAIDPRLAPDMAGPVFDPLRFLPSQYLYDYVPGYSKRTLLGGFLPVADIGVWNPVYRTGYEVMVLVPSGEHARPLGRVRALLARHPPEAAPRADAEPGTQAVQERYWNGTAEDFFLALFGVWKHWSDFFSRGMEIEIPDPWLADAARAGIVLARCSYRGLEPTYQIGEGFYTKIPERSHALFPVAHYEFVWAHQIWNLSREVEPYFQHYLDHYVLPNGDFLYNTQDQVEAPLDVGVFLENSARCYDYTHDVTALRHRLEVLRRMISFVEARYRYGLVQFASGDPRRGLIWGSPEADFGDPKRDFPESHPYFYQNASWIWRGLQEHARCLRRAAEENHASDLAAEAQAVQGLADAMRADIEHSLEITLAAMSPAMKAARIAPFYAFDTHREPTQLSSYENHRYMMDWWTSDWGDVELDLGHFRHRTIAGEQLVGMNTDGHFPRTSNFMEHGTLAGRIRQEDYRPFLLALYGNLCYAMDCGNRYAPEDALLPGGHPGEGSPWTTSAVVNSTLQPAMGLRWLLCYEEHDHDVVHLQKAAPKHWFRDRESIRVSNCPTRFGNLSWVTEAMMTHGKLRWRVGLDLSQWAGGARIIVHVHTPNGASLEQATLGAVHPQSVELPPEVLAGKKRIELEAE